MTARYRTDNSILRCPIRNGVVIASSLTWCMLFGAVSAFAQCVLVQERNGPTYTPHVTVHFGDPDAVPSNIQCSTTFEKRDGQLQIPIYAWNLWDDIQSVELALRVPIEPSGFDRGPQINDVRLHIRREADGSSTTSVELSSDEPLCGPALLGSVRLPTDQLPQQFSVHILEHGVTGRRGGATATGQWRRFAISEPGATIGSGPPCKPDACIHTPVRNLRIDTGDEPGRIHLSWASGSGEFTLLRYRTDGQYPAHPWDGQLLTLLPTSVSSYSKQLNYSGTVHVTGWSVSRGSQGHLLEASNIECGSVAKSTVHTPIAIAERLWQQIKSLYR